MMTNRLSFYLHKRWDKKVINTVCFYPDVFDYSYDFNNYKMAWNQLGRENGRYLMAKRGHLSRVGLLDYLFEMVAGWLGFGNDCHPARVNMAAQKLLYFGYLNGYNQTVAKQVMTEWDAPFRPDPDTIRLSCEPRTNTTSALLQSRLINYYKAHASFLNAPKKAMARLPLPHRENDFVFGATYAKTNEITQVLHLDVQHVPLIKQLLPRIQNGEATLAQSTARRTYVEEQLAQIIQKIEKKIQKADQGGVIVSLQRFLSLLPDETFAELQRKANGLLALYPDPEFTTHYVPLLIQLKLEMAKELPQYGAWEEKEILYREAFQQIVTFSDVDQINDYLYRYFMKDDAFSVLDPTHQRVQEFGKYLVASRLNTCQGDALVLCEYRIAELYPHLILDASLPRFIDSCLTVKNYPLAFELIKRLATTDRLRAVEFIMEHRSKLFSLVSEQKQQVPELAKAFAAYLADYVPSETSSMTLFATNKSKDYEEAALLDPKIIYQQGANYFFELYAINKQWDKACDLLVMRRMNQLPDLILPRQAVLGLAEYLTNQAAVILESATHFIAAKRYQQAEQAYRQSLAMQQKAIWIDKTDDGVLQRNKIHRMLAHCMMVADVANHNVSRARLEEALHYLQQIEQTRRWYVDDPQFEGVYIAVLKQYVDYLHTACLGTAVDSIDKAFSAYQTRCEPLVDPLLAAIDKLISLLNDSDTSDQADVKAQRASYYFLRAEIVAFFRPEADVSDDYQQAIALEPRQPFYRLRYINAWERHMPESDLDEMREQSTDLLAKCHLTEVDYQHWQAERWQTPHERTYNVALPVPPPKPESRGFLSRFLY